MAKFKIQAGAEIDTLTKHEMREVMRDWMVEAVRGVMYRRRIAQGTIASSAVSILANGPREDFTWSVKRISVAGLTGSDTVSIYINDANPGNLVKQAVAGPQWYEKFGSNELVLTGGDHLIIAGSGLATANGTALTVTVGVKEVPSTLVWQL